MEWQHMVGLGSGVDFEVDALAVSGSDVYVGGAFYTAGGNTRELHRQVDGTTWSSLGTSVNDIVYALAVSGTNLYAGGNFWPTPEAHQPVASRDGTEPHVCPGTRIELHSPRSRSLRRRFVCGRRVHSGRSHTRQSHCKMGWHKVEPAKFGLKIASAKRCWLPDPIFYVSGAFTTAGDKASAYFTRVNFRHHRHGANEHKYFDAVVALRTCKRHTSAKIRIEYDQLDGRS